MANPPPILFSMLKKKQKQVKKMNQLQLKSRRRQEWPLFPIIFIIVLDALARTIKQERK